jgi:hypothetical protein
VDWSRKPVQLPTVPGQLQATEATVEDIIKKVDQMPLKRDRRQRIKKMRFAPIELGDFISMVVPGLIPALPLLLTVVPPSVIGKILLKLVTVAD